MRFLACLICLGIVSGSVQAQVPTLQGPILGFIPENDGTAIRPVIGIPGASLLGERLQFELKFRGAAISPKQDYAIATSTEDGHAVVIDLRSGAAAAVSLDADLVAISPTGSAAAVYDHESRILRVIAHVLDAPEIVHEFDASQITGRAANIAISDEGATALVRFVDEERSALWVLDASGASWPVLLDQPSAAAFFPNSSDAVVADQAAHAAFVILDVRRAATTVPLISADEGMSGFTSLAVSENSQRVFLADSNSGNVAIVDLETRQTQLMSCQCQATGLYRLKGISVFRLNEASREPVMVLDASGDEPNIRLIPPRASGEGEAQ